MTEKEGPGRVINFRGEPDIEELLLKAEEKGMTPSNFIKGCIRLAAQGEDIFWEKTLQKFAEQQKVLAEHIMLELSTFKNSLRTLKTRADRIDQETAKVRQDIDDKERALSSLSGAFLRGYSATLNLLRNLRNEK